MTPLVCLLVGRFCHGILKEGWEVTLPCSYQSTCFTCVCGWFAIVGSVFVLNVASPQSPKPLTIRNQNI